MPQEKIGDFIVYCQMDNKPHVFKIDYAAAEAFCREKCAGHWQIVRQEDYADYCQEMTTKKLFFPGNIQKSINSTASALKRTGLPPTANKYMVVRKNLHFDFQVRYYNSSAEANAQLADALPPRQIDIAAAPPEKQYQEIRAALKEYEDIYYVAREEFEQFFTHFAARFEGNPYWNLLQETLTTKTTASHVVILPGDYDYDPGSQRGLRIDPVEDLAALLRKVFVDKMRRKSDNFLIVQKDDPRLYTSEINMWAEDIKNQAAREKFIELLEIDPKKVKKVYHVKNINNYGRDHKGIPPTAASLSGQPAAPQPARQPAAPPPAHQGAARPGRPAPPPARTSSRGLI